MILISFFILSSLFLLFESSTLCFFGLSHIRHHSFLPSTYKVKGNSSLEFYVRQVPGDGSCLFHSLAAGLSYLSTSQHLNFDKKLRSLSKRLREISIETLSEKNKVLVMEKDQTIFANELLEIVSEHYNCTSAEQYLEDMKNSKTWGGGPEIVAISNSLSRPVHVYELCCDGFIGMKSFKLTLCGQFGSPTFDNQTPLFLLCADGRFPDIRPGEQKKQGDHFLALFPKPITDIEIEKKDIHKTKMGRFAFLKYLVPKFIIKIFRRI